MAKRCSSMANGICSDQMINLHNTMTWESSTWDIVRKLNMQPHNTINNSSKKQNTLSAYNANRHKDEHSTYNCTVCWATVSTGAVLAGVGVGAGLSVCQSVCSPHEDRTTPMQCLHAAAKKKLLPRTMRTFCPYCKKNQTAMRACRSDLRYSRD